MGERVLCVEESNGVTVLTMNRPQSANALSVELLNEMQAVLKELSLRNDARAVILTGAGTKVFCAGADLKERKTMNETEVRRTVASIRAVVSGLANLPVPVIAAVNGAALGGGTELAIAADIRIAAASAQFGLPETSLAIIPGAGGTQRLPRLIGVAKAKELIYTAARVNAQTALEIGLVNRVVEDTVLLPASMELARKIAANGPLAVRQAKFAIDYGLEADMQTGLAIESHAYEAVIPSQDRLEGLRAFAEKRRPVYRGL